MHTVINPAETVLVDRFDENFLVKDLASKDSRILHDSEFHGNSFKYENDFSRKFLSCFPDKTSIIFTFVAEEAYMHLMNANREGIFEE